MAEDRNAPCRPMPILAKNQALAMARYVIFQAYVLVIGEDMSRAKENGLLNRFSVSEWSLDEAQPQTSYWKREIESL